MTVGRSRGKVWRACASAWAQLPPTAVKAGDRASESVVRDALAYAIRFLSTASGKDPVGDGLEADWVTAAFATLDRDGDGLVGYEDFLDIVEQYWDLAALAGNSVLDNTPSNQVRPAQTEQDDRLAQIERLCGQAFLWVDPEGVEALSVSQAKTALAVVFNCIGVPNPPDQWHNIAFQNFDEDADGLIEFEEMHEIALQHCELIWAGGLEQLPEPADATDGRHVGVPAAQGERDAGRAPPLQGATAPAAVAAAAAISAPPGSSIGMPPLAPSDSARHSASAAACAHPGSTMGAAPCSAAPGSFVEAVAFQLQEQGVPRSALDETLLSKEECREMIRSSLQQVPGSTLPPDQWCDLAFGNFDEDGDGQVTAEEAVDIMEEWLAISSPEPGNDETQLARNSAMPSGQERLLVDTGAETVRDVFSPPDRKASQEPTSVLAPPPVKASTSALETGSSAVMETAAVAAGAAAQQEPSSALAQPQPVQARISTPEPSSSAAQQGASSASAPPAAKTRTSALEPGSSAALEAAAAAAPAQQVPSSILAPPPAAQASTSALTPHSSAAVETAAPAASSPSPDGVPASDAGRSIQAVTLATPQVTKTSTGLLTTVPPSATSPSSQGVAEARASATTPKPPATVVADRGTDVSEGAIAAAMANAISRKTVNPRKTVRLDDAAPVTHEIPGTSRRSNFTSVRSSTIMTSTVSSLKSEVWDIYGTFGGSTVSQSMASIRPRRSVAAPMTHTHSRKSVVPVAAQILVPAYSGQLLVFTDYEFKEEKGGGAFGRVMRVQHRRMGLQRACKAVAIRGARQFELVETEVALMRKLDHPNVLRLFESYYDGERNIYLIIELCNGGSLTDRMAAHIEENGRGGLPELQAASAMQDLLTALQYCHRKGIIHRDIKPDNLLYVTKASDSKLKVIDFGLSDFLAKIEQKAQELEKQGDRKDKRKRAAPRIGTPHYMAAEVYLEGIYDERVDTFACGVVMAEALTGVHPFFELSKDNLETIRSKILRGKVDFKARHWESVPVLAKQLAGNLLEPDRRKRFLSSQALAHPWLMRNRSLLAGRKGAEVKRQVFDGLSRFRHYNVLKQAASRVIAKQLDDAQLGNLQHQFQLLDADSSGSLSAAELQDGARRCGKRIENLEVEEILEGLSPIQSNNAAEIYYTDFLAALLEHGVALSEAQLREVFLRFSSGAEKISHTSLESAIRAARPGGIAPGTAPPPSVPASGTGEDANELELRQVFEELGGPDGFIDFPAFASMWVPQERI